MTFVAIGIWLALFLVIYETYEVVVKMLEISIEMQMKIVAAAIALQICDKILRMIC